MFLWYSICGGYMKQALEYLKKLLKKDDSVVVGVSTGPDGSGEDITVNFVTATDSVSVYGIK